MTRDRPVLAVDVDGVISLFGFDGPLDQVGRTLPPDRRHGALHLRSRRARSCCASAEVYELIWATGWEDRANDHLPLILGLPGELPCLRFDGRARFGTAHWKLEALERYSGDRPLAWIDDSLDESCHAWAAGARAPTLLVADRVAHRDHRGAHRDAAWRGLATGTLAAEGPVAAGQVRETRLRGRIPADLLPDGDPEDPRRAAALSRLVGLPRRDPARGGAAGAPTITASAASAASRSGPAARAAAATAPTPCRCPSARPAAAPGSRRRPAPVRARALD